MNKRSKQKLDQSQKIIQIASDNIRTFKILCPKCNLEFWSQESLKLHFNCCDGPKLEMPAEKMQITIVEKYSCSKCDMDFDLGEALKEHSENCKDALAQPAEVNFDHTYSKATNLKVNFWVPMGMKNKFVMNRYQVLN